ncbi:conjugal transfer protein TraX [Pseudomonas chlororaphis]|uniref:TraX family protein n=1 Tax=Pseudomonas chlororaphis TaxID=587753 RepID=UPI00209A6A5D|nr:TraX family protein [Pseudomonas chlororaphis]MCO7574416.1 conjugal transfer protein TraX [Pseudomonas chlororaphis]MCO7592019.1 conjugal transfer protein TraX [Pseudomonas chlororaphis]
MRDAMLKTDNPRRNGALDALKWLALLSMVLDHLRYVGLSLDWLYVPGRLAFPWFCLAMAVNLTRLGDRAGSPSGQWRYLGRLLLFSGLSEIPYRLFVPDPDTLNVLPTLALGLLVARGWQRPRGLALALGLAALLLALGFSRWLMFGAFGVLLPLALLLVQRRPWYFSLLPGALCLAANQWETLFPAARLGNWVATCGIAACLLAPLLGLMLLRVLRGCTVLAMRRWAYGLYPLHFLLLLAVRAAL